MTTETAKRGIERRADPRRPVALLFELENSAVDGRKVLYDVSKSLLADRGVELNPVLFSRHWVGPALHKSLPAVLDTAGKRRLSAEKLAGDIADGVKRALTEDRPRMSPGFSKLLQKVKDKHAAIGALTSLPQETADCLVKSLGLAEMQTRVHYTSQEAVVFPTADGWLKLAKIVAVPPGGCTVLSTSSASCKAALSAGMHCVAFPDDLTSFQDFSGSDLVVNKLSDENLADILSVLVQSR